MVLDEERKTQISSLFIKHQELTKVAKEMNISRTHLHRWMKKNGAIMKVDWKDNDQYRIFE